MLGSIGSRWLLGEAESIFCKGVAPDRLPKFQWIAHTHEYMSSANGNQWLKTRSWEELGEEGKSNQNILYACMDSQKSNKNIVFLKDRDD